MKYRRKCKKSQKKNDDNFKPTVSFVGVRVLVGFGERFNGEIVVGEKIGESEGVSVGLVEGLNEGRLVEEAVGTE